MTRRIFSAHNLLFNFYRAVYIESTGALAPEVLFPEAVKILSQKCRSFLDDLKNGL